MLDHKLTSDAIAAIHGPRAETHGDFGDTLTRIAQMWTAYLKTDITPGDAAKMLVLMKLARSRNRYNRDHYLDSIGYILIAEALDR